MLKWLHSVEAQFKRSNSKILYRLLWLKISFKLKFAAHNIFLCIYKMTMTRVWREEHSLILFLFLNLCAAFYWRSEWLTDTGLFSGRKPCWRTSIPVISEAYYHHLPYEICRIALWEITDRWIDWGAVYTATTARWYQTHISFTLQHIMSYGFSESFGASCFISRQEVVLAWNSHGAKRKKKKVVSHIFIVELSVNNL